MASKNFLGLLETFVGHLADDMCDSLCLEVAPTNEGTEFTASLKSSGFMLFDPVSGEQALAATGDTAAQALDRLRVKLASYGPALGVPTQ